MIRNIVFYLSLLLFISMPYSVYAESVGIKKSAYIEAKKLRNKCYQRQISKIEIPDEYEDDTAYRAKRILTEKKLCDQKFGINLAKSLKCKDITKKIDLLQKRGNNDGVVRILQIQKLKKGCSFND